MTKDPERLHFDGGSMIWRAGGLTLLAVVLTLATPVGVHAAVNYFNERTVVHRSATWELPRGASPIATVSCAKGWRATGGGYRVPDPDTAWANDSKVMDAEVRASYPDAVNQRVWSFQANWLTPGGSWVPYYPERWVVCVR